MSCCCCLFAAEIVAVNFAFVVAVVAAAGDFVDEIRTIVAVLLPQPPRLLRPLQPPQVDCSAADVVVAVAAVAVSDGVHTRSRCPANRRSLLLRRFSSMTNYYELIIPHDDDRQLQPPTIADGDGGGLLLRQAAAVAAVDSDECACDD